MIGVVIPAQNEECLLAGCLASILLTASHLALLGEPVQCVVVLGRCVDGSTQIVSRMGLEAVRVDACNVGVARAAGARRLLERGAGWLAFTDADGRVADNWLGAHLAAQLASHTDAVRGTVSVDDWHAHPLALRAAWQLHYGGATGIAMSTARTWAWPRTHTEAQALTLRLAD